MNQPKVYTAIGLMSGTSLDGEIDVALIRTDGQEFIEAVDFKPFPYDISVRDKVRACFGMKEPNAKTKEAEKLVTDLHIRAVQESGFQADIIGFHGQTITHDPEGQFTWQLGDGQRLADETGMDVVYDLRQADIKAGGQGAPLIPVYHAAMMAGQEKPVAVLNLGGVANVTYIGPDQEIVACDIGPANALIDDYMHETKGMPYDEGGQIALSAKPDMDFVNAVLKHPYFSEPAPKSLDRNTFKGNLSGLPDDFEAAVASLTMLSVQAVVNSVDYLPAAPKVWYACGGGRKNKAIMSWMADALGVPVLPVENAGWNGDAIEAQGFAYLAVRSHLGYPLTLPSTTGVSQPQAGGVIRKAKR